MPDPAPSAPDAAAARSWVWHATVESRAAGKVSVLACAETLFAVALYWWIAIRWDTHWHLLTSVFIAPLLLLRSPESMKLGVRWFMKDWFGFESYENWSKAKRMWWLVGALIFIGLANYLLVNWLTKSNPIRRDEYCILFFILFLIISCSLKIAIMGSVRVKRDVIPQSRLMTTGACADECVADGAGGALLFLGVTVGAGLALRGFFFRLCATIRHLSQGFYRLGENWLENNFRVDAFMPAELIPGIREEDGDLTFEGLFKDIEEEENFMTKWFFVPLLAILIFLPAFLYRLNIKATCWFWWPLAYLLKPVPKADKVSAQKQALCWPWDNPLQMLLILVPGVLVLGLLIVENCDFSVWKEFKNAAAVPIPLKVALGMGWSHIPPWHWALLIVEATGLMMLAIAGKARSHRASENWDDYAHTSMQRDLWLMDKLMRLRSLGAKAFMLLGLGMCLISFPEWRQHLPGPLLQRLERFYHAQEVHESAPAAQSLKSGPAASGQNPFPTRLLHRLPGIVPD